MRKTLCLAMALLLLLTLFACDKKPAEQLPEAQPTKAPTEPLKPEAQAEIGDFFSGDWYGWWCIRGGEGIYQDRTQEDNWWDACVRIDTNQGTLSFWDQECSAGEPLATLQVRLLADGPAAGCLCVTDGSFLNMEVPKGSWLISPKGSQYENVIRLTGRYDDPENPGSSFDFSIMLKPWGADWENVPPAERPYYYQAWYLPLAEAESAMPDAID